MIQQEPGAVGVDPAALTQLGQHFQHTGHPIQAQVFGNDEVHIRIGKFQLVQGRFLGECPGGNAVGAAAAVVPEGRAVAAVGMENALLVQFQHGIGSGVYEANNIEHHSQTVHLRREGLRAVLRIHVCGRQQQRLFDGELRVHQLTHGTHIVLRLPVGPQRPHPQIAPVMLRAAGQQQAHGKFRRLLGRGIHRLLQPAEILLTQAVEALRVSSVLHCMAVLGRFIPIGDVRQTGKRVELKLDPAAAGCEEVDALLQGLQYPLHPVIPRQIGPGQKLIGQPVHLQPVGVSVQRDMGRDAEPGRYVRQTFQQQRIEGAALSPQDHGDGRIVVKGFFVAPLAGQRVVDICQSHHLRGDGDSFPPQPVRVAVAVPPLMVPAADLQGVTEQRLFLSEGHLLQDHRAGCRVGLHHGKFLRGQLPRLIQNLLRDGDLADIMEGGSRFDQGDVLLGKVVGLRLLYQPAEQQLRYAADAADMVAALMVAELHHMAENSHHQVAVFLFFPDLVGHQMHQPLLVGIELQGIFHAAAHNKGVEGAADIVRNAHGVCLLNGLTSLIGGDHDDRDLVDPPEAVHLLQHLKAVHLQHIDVQQHQIHRQLLFHQPDSLPPILSLNIVILLPQDLHQHHAIQFRIVNDQDRLSFHTAIPSCFRLQKSVSTSAFCFRIFMHRRSSPRCTAATACFPPPVSPLPGEAPPFCCTPAPAGRKALRCRPAVRPAAAPSARWPGRSDGRSPTSDTDP